MSANNSNSGAQAGQEAKGLFNGIQQGIDSMRGGVNSFADQAIGTHGREDKSVHSFTTDESKNGRPTGTGMSKDAETLGQGIKDGIDSLGSSKK